MSGMRFPSFPGLARLQQLLTGFFVRITGDTMTGALVVQRVGGGSTIAGQTENAGAMAQERYQNNIQGALFQGRKARGTIAAPAVIVLNDEAFRFTGQSYDGTTFVTIGTQVYRCIEPVPAPGAMGGEIIFQETPIGGVGLQTSLVMNQQQGMMYGASAAVNTFLHPTRVFQDRLFTVGTLPAGAQGMRTMVTNALAPAFNAAVAGGGAATVPVFYTGAAWNVG